MWQTIMVILTLAVFMVMVTDLYKSGKRKSVKVMIEDENEINIKIRRTI